MKVKQVINANKEKFLSDDGNTVYLGNCGRVYWLTVKLYTYLKVEYGGFEA